MNTGPRTGKRTWPPWLWPASTKSIPQRAALENWSGEWLSRIRKSASGMARGRGAGPTGRTSRRRASRLRACRAAPSGPRGW